MCNCAKISITRERDTTVLNLLISNTEDGQINLKFVSSIISIKFDRQKKEDLTEQNGLQGACPCIPPTTLSRHVVDLRLSPLLKNIRNVVEKLAQVGRNAKS